MKKQDKKPMVTTYRFKAAEIGVFSEKDSDPALETFVKGCRIIGLTMGRFSLIDLIYSVLKKTGPARVVIGTWSAGIKDVHQVKWMIDTSLISDIKILTDHSYATRQKKYAASITELFGDENIRTSEMHAKFVLIENNEFKVTIRSSMNLNANRTCELFEIDEGPEYYDFLMNFVLHTFENMEPGFIESSTKINKVVSAFFNKSLEPRKNWWEIGGKEE